MKRVWLCECQCPQRHTIVMAAGEADGLADAETRIMRPLRGQLASLLEQKILNPWCKVCKAPAIKWHFELGETKFDTLEEATPILAAEEAKEVDVATANWVRAKIEESGDAPTIH